MQSSGEMTLVDPKVLLPTVDGSASAQWRKVGEEAIRFDLEERSGLGKPRERVLPEASEGCAGSYPIASSSPGFGCDDDLAPMPDRAHSGCGVDRQPHISRVGDRGLPGMDADAQSEVDLVGPFGTLDDGLDLNRGVYRGRRVLKYCEGLIGTELHHMSADLEAATSNDFSGQLEQSRVPIPEPAQQRR